MRQIYPVGVPGDELAAPLPGDRDAAAAGVQSEYSAAVAGLAELYAYPDDEQSARPWVRANMISSADGAAALAGHSGGLSGRADRAVFAVLRSLADVILVGAGTARTERYRPVRVSEIWPSLRAGRAATPAIAVVSRALDLDPAGPLLAGASAPAQTIVLTTRAAPPAQVAAVSRLARVIVAGEDTVQPGAAIAALADLGHRRILTEGGPRLLAQIVAAGLLDDLCLTYSPVLAGGDIGRVLAPPADGGTPADGGSPRRLTLAHVLEDDGHLLCRYLPRSSCGTC